VFCLSAVLNQDVEWNFRIITKRLIVIKTKGENSRNLGVLDVVTGLIFTVETPSPINLDELEINHEYIFDLHVYTSKNLDDVAVDFVSFFEALDVEQSMEDFIKAYWVYPTKIRFQLTEIEDA
jgi:hypothetical protein